MTDILAHLLKGRFELGNPEGISVYGLLEKIEINLGSEVELQNLGKLGTGVPVFNNHRIIQSIADKVFDVNFSYNVEGNIGPAIFFKPSSSDKYSQNFANHYIQVHLPDAHPVVTISTGNRGAGMLLESQREKYMDFIEKVYQVFWTRLVMKELGRADDSQDSDCLNCTLHRGL